MTSNNKKSIFIDKIRYTLYKGIFYKVFNINILIIKSIIKNGLSRTFILIIRNILHKIIKYKEIKFDLKHNIDTIENNDTVDSKIVGDNAIHGEGYVITPRSIIRRFFSIIPDNGNKFTFIDIGSGKGRILFYASEYNFEKIIGLEYSEKLHRICKNNIDNYINKKQKCYDVESILIDASEYIFPEDNIVIFMFNPFRSDVLKKIIDNIKIYHKKYGKKIYIGYYNPRYSDVIENQDFLIPISAEKPALYVSVNPIWPFAIFESIEN